MTRAFTSSQPIRRNWTLELLTLSPSAKAHGFRSSGSRFKPIDVGFRLSPLSGLWHKYLHQNAPCPSHSPSIFCLTALSSAVCSVSSLQPLTALIKLNHLMFASSQVFRPNRTLGLISPTSSSSAQEIQSLASHLYYMLLNTAFRELQDLLSNIYNQTMLNHSMGLVLLCQGATAFTTKFDYWCASFSGTCQCCPCASAGCSCSRLGETYCCKLC